MNQQNPLGPAFDRQPHYAGAVTVRNEEGSMKTYPPIRFVQDAYRAEMARHLHDRMAAGMVEVLWHGTIDYQRFIERDGLEHQRALLGQIRTWRNDRHKILESAEASWPVLLRDATKMERAAAKMADSRFAVEHKKAAVMASRAKEQRKLVADSTAAAEGIRKRIAQLDEAENRLSAALLYFAEHPPKRAEEVRQEPPAPIVNINVEPTPITVEAIMPAVSEMAITSMPQRLTEITVHRDEAGDIASSVQIERDL